MFDVMADWLAVPLLNAEAGNPPQRMALAHPSIAPYGVFRSRDGKDILISIQSEREWKKLCADVLRQPELPNDPRFSNMVERVRNRAAHRQDRRRQLCDHDPGRIAEAPVRRRHRLCRGQHHGRSRRASASAPHRGRYAERQGELCRAGRDLRRRAAPLRRGAGDRRTPFPDRQAFPQARAAFQKSSEPIHDRSHRSRSLAAMDRPHRGKNRHRDRASGGGIALGVVSRCRQSEGRRCSTLHRALVPDASGRCAVGSQRRRPSQSRRVSAAGAVAAPDVGRRRASTSSSRCASATP